LSVLFYNIFLALFKLGIHLASLFDSKAKKWVKGRKGIFERLEKSITHDEKIV
jgi:3-deoxy-D-manno-octulosonic-acid transferase